ncbi:MAG: hypothetical protein IPP90_22690 [Gemmatimonadaceae bacterium]|nr:hypothetical protein [Gemmatimonadaceae bacterium]
MNAPRQPVPAHDVLPPAMFDRMAQAITPDLLIPYRVPARAFPLGTDVTFLHSGRITARGYPTAQELRKRRPVCSDWPRASIQCWKPVSLTLRKSGATSPARPSGGMR